MWLGLSGFCAIQNKELKSEEFNFSCVLSGGDEPSSVSDFAAKNFRDWK